MKGKDEPWETWALAPKGKGKGKGKHKKGPKGDDPFVGRDLDAELEEIASRPAGEGTFVPYQRGVEIPPPAADPAVQAARAARGSNPPGPEGTYGAVCRGGAGWRSDQQWT